MDHNKEEFITACRILENEGLGFLQSPPPESVQAYCF